MSQRITRDTFICLEEAMKIALNKPTMYVISEDGENLEVVPAPPSIQETGSLPEGYTIDFLLDPATVVAALKKKDIVTLDDISERELTETRAVINSEQNITIVPLSLYLAKREAEDEVIESLS